MTALCLLASPLACLPAPLPAVAQSAPNLPALRGPASVGVLGGSEAAALSAARRTRPANSR